MLFISVEEFHSDVRIIPCCCFFLNYIIFTHLLFDVSIILSSPYTHYGFIPGPLSWPEQPSHPHALHENKQYYMKRAVSPSSIQVAFKAGLWSLFITSKCVRDVSITTPDVQISRVVSALTVPSLPDPIVYLRRGALAAGGESCLIVSSCNITRPSLRGQRLCTRIHNPAWNGIAATSADRYWITRLLVWPNFYTLFMKD